MATAARVRHCRTRKPPLVAEEGLGVEDNVSLSPSPALLFDHQGRAGGWMNPLPLADRSDDGPMGWPSSAGGGSNTR